MKKNTQNSRETLKNGEKHSKFMNMHTVHTLDEKALKSEDFNLGHLWWPELGGPRIILIFPTWTPHGLFDQLFDNFPENK